MSTLADATKTATRLPVKDLAAARAFESTGEAAGTHTRIAFEVSDIAATVGELVSISDRPGNVPRT